jgi:hypothetical protein
MVDGRDSDAHPDREGRAAGDLDWSGEHDADLLDGVSRSGSSGVLAEDHEFVAAEPGYDVVSLAGDGLQAVADLNEDPVAGGVSVLIVDRFEAVEVKEDHCAGLAAAVMAGHGDLESRQNLGAVCEAGEAVVKGLVDEHGFLLLALDRIGDRADDVVVVDATLDEVILRTFADREEGEGLVLLTTEHDDRDSGGGHPHPLDGFQAVGVGKAEVEQDAIEGVAFERGDGGREAAGDLGGVGRIPSLLELRGNDAGLDGAVLDEQDTRYTEAGVGSRHGLCIGSHAPIVNGELGQWTNQQPRDGRSSGGASGPIRVVCLRHRRHTVHCARCSPR